MDFDNACYTNNNNKKKKHYKRIKSNTWNVSYVPFQWLVNSITNDNAADQAVHLSRKFDEQGLEQSYANKMT